MPNFISPGQYQSDPTGSGFAVPNLGGSVGVRYGSLLWTGTIGTLFQLPQGAQITGFETHVFEAFNGGTASMRVGDTTTNNRWGSTIDIGTVGQYKTGYIGSQILPGGTLTDDTYILAKLNAPGTATAGTVAVIAYYAMNTRI